MNRSVLYLLDQQADLDFIPVASCAQSVATKATLAGGNGKLVITVAADDPNMSALIATGPEPGVDKFLYEEDCLQFAIWDPARPGALPQLLVNPLGKQTLSPETKTWQITATCTDQGWQVELTVPVPESCNVIGISVHRFYRGIRGEVHGLKNTLPHPLDPAAFIVAVLQDNHQTIQTTADTYRKQATAMADEQRACSLTAARQRLAAADPNRIETFLDLAINLARQRAKLDVTPNGSFLCWNEAYYQLALMDLYELTGERAWLDIAIPRMDRVWEMRSDRRGVRDKLRDTLVPTWINDRETDAACTLVSGAILNPIARMIRLVRQQPDCEDLVARTETWINLCREVLDFHNHEWVELPDGSGMHLEPYEKGPSRVYPSGGSRINPLNRQFWLSMPMLNIGLVTDTAEYLRKAGMSALFFKNTSDWSEDGCMLWEYEVASVPSVGEDLSHAQSQIHFAHMCEKEGIVFSQQDIKGMANTLKHRVFRHGDVPCDELRGSHPGLHSAVGVWSILCAYVPEVFPAITRVLSTMIVEGDPFFSAKNGWGIRNLTMLELARRDMET